MKYFPDLNKDQVKRDEIIGTSFITDKSTGGLKTFLNLSLEQLQQLLQENFILADSSYNARPTIAELLNFALECLKVAPALSISFDGFAIDTFRWDYNVDIEAIRIRGKINSDIKLLFLKFVDGADETKVKNDYLYAWWD